MGSSGGMSSFSEQVNVQGLLYRIADIIAIVASALLAYFVIFDSFVLPTQYQVVVILSIFLALSIFSGCELYGSWRGRSLLVMIRQLIIGWTGVLVSMLFLAFFLDVADEFARRWVFAWSVITLMALFSARSAATMILRSFRERGWNHKRIVIIGAGKWAEKVLRTIHSSDWSGLDVVCMLDHRNELHGRILNGVPVRGGYELLRKTISDDAIDEVWICLPLSSSRDPDTDFLNKVREILRNNTVTQRLVPNFEESWLMNRAIIDILGLPVVNLNASPMRGINQLIKDVEDKILAAVILVMVSPLMLAIATIIKITSPGPILFKQMRHGWDGRPIKVYKFRTMKAHEETTDGVTQARYNDPRVTTFGRFLRSTSLDELPQFYNVLQGKMSVVGPRPHAIAHNEYYMDQIDSYMQRHKVKPGITGWAQVNGWRGETETLDKMKRRVEHDLYYIENWSFWFDIKIIFLTLVKGFANRNAY